MVSPCTSRTGMGDFRPRISGSWLACVGARCWIRTKAIPVLDGRCSSSCEKASSPPAEAPIPTMGKELSRRGEIREPGGIREPGIVEAAFAMEDAGAGLPAVLRGVLWGSLLPLFFAIPDPPCGAPAARRKQDISAWHWACPAQILSN